MSSTTTKTTIANRALQLLGYKPIGSLNDNDRGARAVNRAYDSVLQSELRGNFWSFSIKRLILAPSNTKPIFGKNNYFPLPGDFLSIAPPDQYVNIAFGGVPSGPLPSAPNTGVTYADWQIEAMPGGGLAIVSDDTPPLYIRYVSSSITESMFDTCFAEALAAALAMEICEELTQSNTKIQTMEKLYTDAMNLAKKRNAYEEMPVQPPIDPWILIRF